MSLIEGSGMGITVVMLVIWLLAARHIADAKAFPSLVHGALKVSSAGMRLTWIVLLLFSLVIGGPTIARKDDSTLPVRVSRPDFWGLSDMIREPQTLAERVVRGSGHAMRLGAYGKATHTWELRSGDAVSYSIAELRLPLYFPLALLVYWFGVGRNRTVALNEERAVLP